MRFFSKIKIISFLLLVVIAVAIFKNYTVQRDIALHMAMRHHRVTKADFVQKVTVAGQLYPKRRSVINAPFDGYIQKLYVQVGDSIKKGDPIVALAENLTIKDLSFPIRAPFDGKVVLVNHQEGEYVVKGSNPDFIVYIDDLSDFIIKVDLPEVDLLKVKKGQKVIVKFSAIQSHNYEGVVDEISLSPVDSREIMGRRGGGSSSSSYPITVRLTNPDEKIKVGLSAVLDIITYEKKGVLALPHEFIQKEDNDYFVFNLKGEKKKIQIGVQNESLFEILGGISENSEVKQIDFFNLGE